MDDDDKDIALCGDETCESPSCKQSAVDAYYARADEAARVYVRTLLGLPL